MKTVDEKEFREFVKRCYALPNGFRPNGGFTQTRWHVKDREVARESHDSQGDIYEVDDDFTVPTQEETIAPLHDKSEVVFEVYSGPDGKGRHGFTMYWWDEGYHLGPCRRAQVFLANMQEHKEKWEAQGRTVRTIKEQPRKRRTAKR